jgi:pimeloyl-ACP methyl ester carboxylesterase
MTTEGRTVAEEFTHHTHDGFSLAVQTGGPPDAPALLLLPGQANNHHWWDGLRGGFEDTFRTVTFDYRGTGQSRGELGEWTSRSFAEDALEVLDRLGVDHAAVYGTSLGGRVAQMLAIDHPDRVTALVLACSSPGGRNAPRMSAETTRELARATPDARRALLHALFYTPGWPHPPEASTLLGDPTMSPQEQVAHRRVSDRHDAGEALSSLDVPTLVLHGEDDRMTPAANSALLAELIPGARLHLYPGARHGFFEEFSAQVTPEIIGFLRAAHTDPHTARSS